MRLGAISYGPAAGLRASMDAADVAQLAAGVTVGQGDSFVHGFTIANSAVHGVSAAVDLLNLFDDQNSDSKAARHALMAVGDTIAAIGSGVAAHGVWSGLILSAAGSVMANFFQASRPND